MMMTTFEQSLKELWSAFPVAGIVVPAQQALGIIFVAKL